MTKETSRKSSLQEVTYEALADALAWKIRARRAEKALEWIAAHEYDAHQTRDNDARALINSLIANARAALAKVQS